MTLDWKSRAGLCIASGLMLAAAFPKADLNLLVWFAFVPLLYALEGQPIGRVFLLAWLQGFVCYVASVYWIALTLHNFTSLPVGLAILPMLLLAAVMGLFTAAAFALSSYVADRLAIPLIVTLPLSWVAFEWVRTYFPIGFPWNLLGYAVYRNLELIQFAEFTGIYGVSALIIFTNAVIYAIAVRLYSRRVQMAGLATLTGLMAAAFIFGFLRIRGITAERAQGSLRVAMVQGDIPQSLKWDPKFLATSFKIYVDLTESAARRGVDLIVWPEAAAAFFVQPDANYPAAFAEDAHYRQQLLELARRVHEPILLGAPALGVEDGRVGFYNRAYLITAAGTIAAWYDKIQLVPFGEYVPLRRFFGFFVNRVVSGFGDMFPGRTQTVFRLGDVKLGVLICYESIFPNLARGVVKKGAGILVNITNDAWYGETSAPYQLLAMAAMRSVETKTPMVRVANTGISAIIDPAGQITATTPLFSREAEIERVYWRPERTVYTEVGDVFAITCSALTMLGLLAAIFFPRPPLELPAPMSSAPLSLNGRTLARRDEQV